MKNILKTLAGVLLLVGCQNELYIDPQEEFGSAQGSYMASKGAVQVFVEEGKDYFVKDVRIGLSLKESKENNITLQIADQSQLDEYNKKNSTAYVMLPKEMYEMPSTLEFKPNMAIQILPINLKNIKFSTQGDYALPLRITGGTTTAIPGEAESILILEQLTRTKVLKMPFVEDDEGGENELGSDKMFPEDFTVPQWTMEMMIKRSKYDKNNMAIAGTKRVNNSDPNDEIYTRFGDVTIDPNQLQIKTGSSQIDVSSDNFAAKPDVWYMISFVYDGKNTLIYINGEQVAEQQIRTGAYGLTGFWLSGKNEFIREVRFWSVARNAKQIKENVWKKVNPDDKGLLLYYPCNGKKRDFATGQITDDETKLWNWASSYSGDKEALNLELKETSSFDDNNGELYTFPLMD